MSKSKSIEDTFKKMSPREHILHRPGMYIGDTKKCIEEMWVIDSSLSGTTDDDTMKMVKKMVEYSPGFLKVFDEVLTNALDHSNRDPTVDKIKLDFDQSTGEISVYNTGTGIPVVVHKDHNIYVPELIFGHLLSSSNYDDTQKRIGAGVNGLGVKLANIYSKRFVIETVDSERGLKYVQEFSDNMNITGKPKVTKCSTKSYTKITFLPDYSRFGMSGLEADVVSLIKKRTVDCIACSNKNVNVYVNGAKLKGKGLGDYVRYFFDEDVKTFSETHTSVVGGNEMIWEYVIVPWEKFEHVSFVNGNSTYTGGKHVDHIMYQIINKLKGLLETKKKLSDVKPAVIREKMFLFLRATVVNPQFSSQTKEFLTTQAKDFGVKVEVPEKFIEKLWKSSIIEDIVEFHKLKASLDLAKQTDGSKKKRVFIPKLEDAHWAGTQKSDLCTLILTEGDSAKTFAMWGRSVVGTEKFGVYPLKGKVLNVRDATSQQVINNEEINNIKQILGLKQDKDYKNTSDLRYGKVMILTDADVDGSHIKGLLINVFHCWWPSLLKLNYIQSMRTPIVKATKGKKVVEFYNQQDYENWKAANGSGTNGYQIRYYKGLGTSKREDAKEAFTKIEELKADYYYTGNKCDEAILLAFEKDKNVKKGNGSNSADVASESTECTGANGVVRFTDKRKAWLSNYDKDSYVDMKQHKISYRDFIHKELIHFSVYDNVRSIPSLCDGLKPSQRKILYYMLKKNLINKEIKVAQLSGYVSAETSYHHGEASLQQAIIGMAQDFVGSNNLNLLKPDSNFGSCYAGGKDAASPRYIFTRLCEVTPHIFNQNDLPLLSYLKDDGQQIEPEWFLPIIPMILVNGCEGIGTGYSTYIPPHNPKDVVSNLLRLLDNKDPLPMTPYFRGFNGILDTLEEGKNYMTRGKWEHISDTQIKITALPVGVWITPYKEFLESLVEGNGAPSKKDNTNKKTTSKGVVLKDVKNTTVDENTGVSFIVEFKSAKELDKLVSSRQLERDLKLTKQFNVNNMYLFDDNLTPVKYDSTTDILLDFYDIRLDFYEKRKAYLTKKLSKELDLLQSKVRFIDEYINGYLQIARKSKVEIESLLEDQGFRRFGNESETDAESEQQGASFDYIIRMPFVSLTKEKIAELESKRDKIDAELRSLKSKSAKDLWKDDLFQLNDIAV